MKRIAFSLWLSLVCSAFMNVHAQNDIKLPGVIAMQNSQYNTGHRIYIADANIKSTAKCTPTTSDSKGEFTLVFSDKPAGDAATVFVNKDGLEVVNEKDLEEAAVVGRLAPLQVYMCKKGELEANKEAYYLISDSAIQSIYNARLKILLQKQGKEYNTTIISLEKELKDTIKNSDEAITALNEQLQAQKKQVKDAIGEFAIVNLDDQSETYQRAFAKFKKGNIDTALAILDKVNLEQRLQTNTEQIQKEKSEVDTINENIELKQQQIHQDVEQALFDARMHKLKYQFEETEASYDLVIKYDSTNYDYYQEYVEFLIQIKNFDKAVVISKDALKIFNNLDQTNSLNKWHVAETELTLGGCYFLSYDFLTAQQYYIKCSKLDDELLKTDSLLYEPKIITQKILLASSYEVQKDSAKAEQIFVEALNIQKKFTQPDSIYWANLAFIEENLGVFYYYQNNFVKADSFFNDALDILLAPGHYDETMYASVKKDLGDLYKETGEYEKAENAYNDALKIYKKNAEKYPLSLKDVAYIQRYLGKVYFERGNYNITESFFIQSLSNYDSLIRMHAYGFEQDMAGLKIDLGVLYDRMDNSAKSESYNLESLDFFDSLSQSHPNEYKLEIAEIKNNLGNIYYKKKDYTKAEAYYLDALDTREQLADKDSAETQTNLGILYTHTGDYTKSEFFYLESLNGYKHLAVSNPRKYEPEVARTENHLGFMYENEKDYAQAEVSYLNSFYIWEKLVKSDSGLNGDLADTENDLGVLYFDMRDYDKAETFYLKSLEGYEILSKVNPENYELDIARTEDYLGILYESEKNYDKAETAIVNALKVKDHLALENPDAFENDYFSTQIKLITLYRHILKNSKSDSVQLKYSAAITLMYEKLYKKSLNENPLSNIAVSDCGNLAWHLLFIKKFKEAETAANWALQIDSSQTWIKVIHANALLFQGRLTEAEKEYLNCLSEIKGQDDKPYKKSIIDELNLLEDAGVTHPDINKIRDLMNK